MSVVIDVVAGTAGVVFGLWAGWRLVKRYGRSRRRFWALNAAAFVVCLAVCALGAWVGALWLVIASLALLFGAITGVKYGWHGGLPGGGELRRKAA